MSAREEVMGNGMLGKALLVAVALLGSAFLLAPRALYGAEAAPWKECVDKAFAEYNDCLMENSSWFNRKLCDLQFELDVVICSAAAAGDVKKAWNEGSQEAA